MQLTPEEIELVNQFRASKKRHMQKRLEHARGLLLYCYNKLPHNEENKVALEQIDNWLHDRG